MVIHMPRYAANPKIPVSSATITAGHSYMVYDTLFGHYYQSDVFFDYEPHLEYLPNPLEGFRAYLSALISY